MLPSSIGGLIRHILTFAGGYVVAKGYTDEVTMEATVGAVMTLVGTGWSFYQKWKAEQDRLS